MAQHMAVWMKEMERIVYNIRALLCQLLNHKNTDKNILFNFKPKYTILWDKLEVKKSEPQMPSGIALAAKRPREDLFGPMLGSKPPELAGAQKRDKTCQHRCNISPYTLEMQFPN